jgi:hypothetical protein
MIRTAAILAFAAWCLVGCMQPRPAVAPGGDSGDQGVVSARPEFQRRAPMLDRGWPLNGEPGKFSFAIIGDKTGGGPEGWPVFDRAVDEINLLRPDFAVMVGDLIPGHTLERHEWDSQWTEFMEHAGRLKVPFLFVPGNHDISNPEMYTWWKEDLGLTYHSFDYRGCHFLLLNTEEDRLDGRGELWERQIRFIGDDLAEHQDARHTFVFMHKPMWVDNRYEWDWPRIDSSLGDRPATVVAGHWHSLQHERVEGRRHMVMGGTGSGGRPSPVKELGAFHHYTIVTVDGDSTHVAVIEPGGAMWPEDIATRSFREAARGLVRIDGAMPSGLGETEIVAGVVVDLKNDLPESVSVALGMPGLSVSNWRLATGDTTETTSLAPGETSRRDFSFSGPADAVADMPMVSADVRYRSERLRMRGRVAPLYPDSTMVVAPEWMVVGPFDIGPVFRHLLPDDPPAGLPGLFARQEPNDMYDLDATFVESGVSLKWQRARLQSDGKLNFNAAMGTKDNVLAYAACWVHSRRDQVVYAQLQADNFAQIVVNSRLLDDGQTYGGTWRTLWAPLPLVAGWNAVVVKLVNNSGDWGFRFRMADPDRELRFAPRPPG